jgi:hypothetical protein
MNTQEWKKNLSKKKEDENMAPHLMEMSLMNFIMKPD